MKINTPVVIKVATLHHDQEATNATQYQMALWGSYNILHSHTPISPILWLVCANTSRTQRAFKALKRILRYLKDSLTFSLRFLAQSMLTLSCCKLDQLSYHKKNNRILYILWFKLHIMVIQKTTNNLTLQCRSKILCISIYHIWNSIAYILTKRHWHPTQTTTSTSL